ncbi:hypothetical protein JCM18899A_35240 [Nocardioides sp. AN3]
MAHHGELRGARPFAPWHLVPWLVVGTLAGFGVLALLTIGPLLLLAAGLVGVGCLLLRLVNRSMAAIPIGLAIAILYLALINKDGPGTVCDGHGSCTEEWSPWPFIAAAALLVVAAVAIWRLSPRIAAVVFPPSGRADG